MSENLEAQVSDILSGLTGSIKRGMPKGVMRAAAHTAGEIASHLGAGALSRSFRATPIEITSDGAVSSWAASRGSARKYAGIQDQGGTIYPRLMRNLAVPIKSAGVAQGKWPRHFGRGELKLVPRPGRPSLLVKELTRRKVVARRSHGKVYRTWVHAIQPMFVLLPSVEIQGKFYLDAVRTKVDDDIQEIIAAAVEEATE